MRVTIPRLTEIAVTVFEAREGLTRSLLAKGLLQDDARHEAVDTANALRELLIKDALDPTGSWADSEMSEAFADD